MAKVPTIRRPSASYSISSTCIAFPCSWSGSCHGFVRRAAISASRMAAMLTERLEVRPPREHDRARFIELFRDEDFMVFSDGVHSIESAHARYDVMLQNAAEVPFAKQPVIVSATGA